MKSMSSHAKVVIIPMHILFLGSFVIFMISPQWHWLYFSLLLWFCFSCLGIAIGYHRLLSHRSFETYKWIENTLALLGCFAGQGSPIVWTSIHRGLHHPHSDREKDPHTPKKGWLSSYLGWQIKMSKLDISPRLAMDLIRNPFMSFISMNYYYVFWFVWAFVFLIHWEFAIYGMVPAAFLAMHQENLINVLGHTKSLGYRWKNLDDNSTNVWILGTLFWGQGFHNNHHAHPENYNFGLKWWEFDSCTLIIPLIKKRKFEAFTYARMRSSFGKILKFGRASQ